MMDVESIDLADETPEVDAAEQRLAVAVEDESGLETTTSTRLKPVVVFVHVLNADGNLIWAELPSRMGFHEFACCGSVGTDRFSAPIRKQQQRVAG